MAVQFYQLPIASVKQVTPDAVTVTFSVPDHLKETFTYVHGQYLTLRLFLDGKDVRRSYSLCSNPFSNEPLTVAVKRVDKGLMSNHINTILKEGALVDVMPPMGNFTIPLSPQHAKKYVLFGGGSGITPLFSILKAVLTTEPKSEIYVFYANRNEESIIFKNEIAQLQQQYSDRLTVVHVLEMPAKTFSCLEGRIHQERTVTLVNQYIGAAATAAEYFLCGPSGMMSEVQTGLATRGIPQQQVHREFFTAPLPAGEETAVATSDDSAPKARKVKVTLFGSTHTIEVQPSETILEALIREDHDPPYACQIGACCTCRAMKVSGEIRMDEREALSDAEIAEGYVLTCQSHPLTDNVEVDYDS